MRSLMICTPTQYCADDKIEKSWRGRACGAKKSWMGRAFGAYGGEEGHIQDFGGEMRRKETTGETQA
jgi:hypothetical protein